MLEQPQRPKHPWVHAGLGARFPGAVDGDFDGLIVSRDQVGVRIDGDGDGERFSTPGTSDEPQVAELGHASLHDGRVVAEFAAVVVVVAGPDGDQRPVLDILESEDFEGDGKRFVGPPVVGQRTAQDARGPGLDQLSLFPEKVLQKMIRHHFLGLVAPAA